MPSNTTTVRRESATTATPATSSGSSRGPSSRSPWCSSSTSPSRTSSGVRTDLGQAATHVPDAARQLLLGVVQLGCVAAPAAGARLAGLPRSLASCRDRRRSGRRRSRDVRRRRSAPRSRSGDPGSDRRRRLVDRDDVPDSALHRSGVRRRDGRPAVVVAHLGRTPPSHRSPRSRRSSPPQAAQACPSSLIAVAIGGLAGSLVLLAFGAPNRRPSPAAIAAALGAAGIDVTQLDLRRAVGGRSQLYRATTPEGGLFLKVYSDDSRDADLLYRSYRTLVLRDSDDGWPPPALARRRRARGVPDDVGDRVTVSPVPRCVRSPRCLTVRWCWRCRTSAASGSTSSRPTISAATLLDDLWRQVHALHRAGLAHRSLRAANVLVTEGRPVLIDFGSAGSAASARVQAIDRAELLASLAAAFGVDTAVAVGGPGSRSRTTSPRRCRTCSRSRCRRPPAGGSPERRCVTSGRRVAEVTARDVAPLERLIRVRPRTIFMIATLTGAFYILLPQLASVDDSVEALRSANWLWLAGAVVMSALTYVASAVGIGGGNPASTPARADDTGGAGVVVRQPGDAGERRRDGAQRPLHAEGRCAPCRGGHGSRTQRPGRWRHPRRAPRRVPVARRATGRVGVPHPEQQQGPRRRRRASSRSSASRWRLVAGGRSPSRRSSRHSASRSPASPRSPGLLAGCRCCSPARPSSRWPTPVRSPSRSPRSTAGSRSCRSARCTSARH